MRVLKNILNTLKPVISLTVVKNIILAFTLLYIDWYFLKYSFLFALGLNHIAEALALLMKIIFYVMFFYLANSRWLSLRLSTGIIFAIFFFADEVFRSITGSVISIPDMDMILRTQVLWKDATIAYLPYIFSLKIIITIGLFLFFYIWYPKRKEKTEPFIEFFVSLGIITYFIVSIFQFPHDSDEYLEMYMPFVRIPAEIVLIKNNPIDTTRKELTETPAHKSQIRNIILVIDESVSFSYFHEENPNIDLEFHEKYKKLITNFGKAMSSINCSYGSRSYLRFASSPDSILNKTALSNPTIWQYAKNAGFSSYLIGYTPINANMLTKEETKAIDYFEHMSVDVHRPYYEIELAKKVKNIIRENDGHNFIFVAKEGMHFPYEASYPDDKAVYHPHLKKGESLRNVAKTRNSYRNALKWSVDSFFDELFKDNELNLNDTIIIYTSDHGEFINTDDSTQSLILQPHCSSDNPKIEEYEVPLLVFTANNFIKNQLTPKRNGFSHFHITPTILKLMGYETEQKSLLDETSEKYPAFYGDPYGRFTPIKVFE